jgi:hypothetical protein
MVTTPATPKDPQRNEYYTPPEVFEALGLKFDLDVCAPKGGIPWIPATRHYSLEDDGLSQPWAGRVWMNPPFSESAKWVERFIEHRNGIALVPTSRARWFGLLWDTADSIVHPVSRPMFQFVHRGKRTNIYMPVVLVAYGDDNSRALHNLGRAR